MPRSWRSDSIPVIRTAMTTEFLARPFHWDGKIDGNLVQIRSKYVEREELGLGDDPLAGDDPLTEHFYRRAPSSPPKETGAAARRARGARAAHDRSMRIATLLLAVVVIASCGDEEAAAELVPQQQRAHRGGGDHLLVPPACRAVEPPMNARSNIFWGVVAVASSEEAELPDDRLLRVARNGPEAGGGFPRRGSSRRRDGR